MLSSQQALWDAYNSLNLELLEVNELKAHIEYQISVISPLLVPVEELDYTHEEDLPRDGAAGGPGSFSPTVNEIVKSFPDHPSDDIHTFGQTLIGLSQPEALRKIAERFDVVEVKTAYPLLKSLGICNASPNKAASALGRAADRAKMVRVAAGVYKLGK